jgi:peptide/nickel transport system substrate-binding protein
MNLAVPPFDDVHVRRAMNLAVNKSAVVNALGGQVAAEIAGHVVINSLLNDLLVSYDPYATPHHAGDLTAARREMAASRYDANGDGRCDDPSCRGVQALALNLPPIPEIARSIRDDLRGIGIELDVKPMDPPTLFSKTGDPSQHVPMAIGVAWVKDYLSASALIPPLFSAASIGTYNYSLVGASAQQLRRWGYDVRSVPGIDDRIARCQALIGSIETECWAELDRYLTEVVVPWVPLVFENWVGVVSDRVTSTSFDQSTSLPALDRTAVT